MAASTRTAARQVLTLPAGAPCTICGSELGEDSPNCPSCGSRPRTRAIPAVLNQIAPKPTERTLLVFAGTRTEMTALRRHFQAFTSVSLERRYGPDHHQGVDARDLSRYDEGSFAGHFSSMLFDYFPEHERALEEAFRVIAPGGLFITHIAPHRIRDDASPPVVHGVALAEEFPNTHVGGRWFFNAVAAAGFDPQWIAVLEETTGETSDWFIGSKPLAPASAPKRLTAAGPTKTLSCPLRPEFGHGHVDITWTLPSLPADCQFGAHAATEKGVRVVVLGTTSAFVSDDGGDSWQERPLLEKGAARLDNAFIRSDGGLLLQSRGVRYRDDLGRDDAGFACIRVLDSDLNELAQVAPGLTQWHGSSGIDERSGTILYGEYPINPILSRDESRSVQGDEINLPAHLYRSTDGGLQWDTVLTLSENDVRHVHTVRADPVHFGVWWASTGDRGRECRTLRSNDDGRTWSDVTGRPSGQLPARALARAWQVVHRYTDVVVTAEHLIWGTDDVLGKPEHLNDPEIRLGERVGARLCVARKETPLRPEVRGWIGNPVRSIVDVGPAWLLTTEAKRYELPRPQLVLVGKAEPFPMQEIGTVDLFRQGGPFTLSRASRAAIDGRFFTFRHPGAVFAAGGPRALQWDIAFR